MKKSGENQKETHLLLGICCIIFILISIGLFIWYESYESVRDSDPNNLRYALSASAQAFAAILVLGLIAVYNHMQFIDKLVKETETRILTYMNQVIEWSYPDWDDRIETHAKANYDKKGFSRGYFVNQIRDYITPYLYRDFPFIEDKLEKIIRDAIDKNMENGSIILTKISTSLSNELRVYRKEDELDEKIESINKAPNHSKLGVGSVS